MLMVLATLFTQLSVAAYACPAAMAGASAQVETPCERMDMDTPNLCERHCHDAQ